MGASTEVRRAGQPNRMTSDAFIQRARAVHGDKYDYSQVEFVNTKTKVKIICPLHGPFMQTPEKHFAGCGCPDRACIAEKHKENSQKKYGVDHWSKAASVKSKKEQTMMDRHGARNAMQVQEFREKHEASCMRNLGAASPLASQDVRDKIKSTMRARHGGDGAMCDPVVREKARATNLKKRGVENVMQDEAVRQAQQDSLERNYGVRNPMQAPTLQRKQREAQKVTMTDLYGADSGYGSEELREKGRETCMEKYGVPNVMMLKQFADKMTASKIANGTTSTSATEDLLYGQLCEVFGVDDVVRQYWSDAYPYACDFYIKSRGMYIELNAGWSHGSGWFGDRRDDRQLEMFREKAVASDFYKTALHVWTVSDVAKRACASAMGLNYIVFWDNQLRDAMLWFSLGMPDGQDYVKAYSWLPERIISAPEPVGLTGTPSNLYKITKAYQFHTFYRRELELWNANPAYRETLLRIWLCHNRLTHIEKNPVMLTDLELMRGFTISGILKGYTVFDTSLMDQAVRKYQIRSVYDPCAGWGERALYCKSHGDMPYMGVDVNPNLFPGYERMRVDFDMSEQQFVHADSASICLFGPEVGPYDSIVTCPPYGGTEIYSEHGAENLPEPEFLDWWSRVVQNSRHLNPRYFCFQVNTAWRDKMLDRVLAHGFELVDELASDKISSSHFTRKRPGENHKKSRETMLVLKNVRYCSD